MKTARTQIDELLEKQKQISVYMDRSTIKCFDLINARRRYHKIDEQITKLCRESGERRVPLIFHTRWQLGDLVFCFWAPE